MRHAPKEFVIPGSLGGHFIAFQLFYTHLAHLDTTSLQTHFTHILNLATLTKAYRVSTASIPHIQVAFSMKKFCSHGYGKDN